MIVGEAPGADEALVGKPFVGVAGQELDRMLAEAGISKADCYITNLIRYRPSPTSNDLTHVIPLKKDVTSDCVRLHDKMVKPVVYEGYQELLKEIELVKPKVIIPMGNTSMWGLTQKCTNHGEQEPPSGITSWRNSLLSFNGIKVVPTYHPAAILRQWEYSYPAVHDLRKAKAEAEFPEFRVPDYRFQLRPTFADVMERIAWLRRKCDSGIIEVAADLETRKGHIACLGLAWSAVDALCIPFMCVERLEGYWELEHEVEIVLALRDLLTHPNCLVLGQNFLYDAQYFAKHWKFIPNVHWDTRQAHHLCFLDLPSRLDFLSSLYCEYHVYWKDEGKEWEPGVPEEQLWNYNCVDAVKTWEIKRVEKQCIDAFELWPQFNFQRELWWACLEAMIAGIKVDLAERIPIGADLKQQKEKLEEFLKFCCGHPLNPRSPKQMHLLFYSDLKIPVIIKRGTKKPTLDDEALEKIATKEPALRHFISAIADTRTIGVLKSTFIDSEVDEDLRMRCMFDPVGTDTLRLSSYENAFGRGMNMQNVPSDKSKSIGKFLRRVRAKGLDYTLPNVRKLFIPDEGKVIFDADLDRADLQVVVWEANDEELKIALREGLDLHLLNAAALFGLPITIEKLRDKEFVKWAKEKYKTKREFAKVFVHGTNYGGSARTMAGHVGITVKEAETCQQMWFYRHPGIWEWRERTEEQLNETRSISNKFGYVMRYLGRVEELLPEALAWVPQSTVGCVINRGWIKLRTTYPKIQVLLQVHDSLVGQFDKSLVLSAPYQIRDCLRIIIPYDDPLIIPVGCNTSEVSWGDCKAD